MKQYKGGLFLFVTSCVPGCGQMYQGYMKRGLSLMLLFWGLLAVAFFLHIEALLFFLVPIWLYTYFDSYNLRGRIERGRTPEEDDSLLFDLFTPDSQRLNALCRRQHSIIGWVLVGLGVYMLYGSLVRRVLDALEYYFEVAGWFYSFLAYDIPRLVVTFGIIALGVWFIRGPKKAVPMEEDIPIFTPPVTQAKAAEEAEHGEE